MGVHLSGELGKKSCRAGKIEVAPKFGATPELQVDSQTSAQSKFLPQTRKFVGFAGEKQAGPQIETAVDF
jgi:hypothetical protein